MLTLQALTPVLAHLSLRAWLTVALVAVLAPVAWSMRGNRG